MTKSTYPDLRYFENPRSAFSQEQIFWAWQKCREGYTAVQVAAALFTSSCTLGRVFERVFGRTSPREEDRIVLEYDPEEARLAVITNSHRDPFYS